MSNTGLYATTSAAYIPIHSSPAGRCSCFVKGCTYRKKNADTRTEDGERIPVDGC